MGILALGNLSVNEFEKRTGWKLSKEDLKWFNSHRIDDTTVNALSNSFHIFDIPFMIQVSEDISEKLNEIINKYAQSCPSKNKLTITIKAESVYDKIVRLKREHQIKMSNEHKNNPNTIWSIRWNMLIPVQAINAEGVQKSLYYGVFINTYIRGRNNIPSTIDGTLNVLKDSTGLHGKFYLDDPESCNNADEFGNNWVVGTGFYHLSGRYIGCLDSFYFNKIEVNIRDALNEYCTILGNKDKEIFFIK